MKHEEMKKKLIEGTTRVIAREGLDRATTKRIGTETNLNEAYIYRCFNGKEELFAGVFDLLDRELYGAFLAQMPLLLRVQMTVVERCRLAFANMWHFMLQNRDKFLCYIRYYYSPYFAKHSSQKHQELYQPVVEKFRAVFVERANVWMLVNHMLNVMINFAVKVYDGSLQDNEDTEEHVFRLIYVSVQQYFKTN
jgi:AcrR family transcriptional regulator